MSVSYPSLTPTPCLPLRSTRNEGVGVSRLPPTYPTGTIDGSEGRPPSHSVIRPCSSVALHDSHVETSRRDQYLHEFRLRNLRSTLLSNPSTPPFQVEHSPTRITLLPSSVDRATERSRFSFRIVNVSKVSFLPPFLDCLCQELSDVGLSEWRKVLRATAPCPVQIDRQKTSTVRLPDGRGLGGKGWDCLQVSGKV